MASKDQHKMKLLGVARPMMFKHAQLRDGHHEHSGNNGKVPLQCRYRWRKWSDCPGNQQVACRSPPPPGSWWGRKSRSTMLAASLAAVVPLVHGQTHISLGQSGGVVGAVTGHGYDLALSLFLFDHVDLSSGLHSAMKPSTPASLGDGRCRQGIVAGAHDRLNADGAQTLKSTPPCRALLYPSDR